MDEQINKELRDNHICPHCGGLMHDRSVTDFKYDEFYELSSCDDCGYSEEE